MAVVGRSARQQDKRMTVTKDRLASLVFACWLLVWFSSLERSFFLVLVVHCVSPFFSEETGRVCQTLACFTKPVCHIFVSVFQSVPKSM